MALYVDGFLLPIPKKRLKDYRSLARLAAKVWRDHGALEYRECVADDLPTKGFTPFAKRVGNKPNETIVLAWIVYRSRAHRDRVNAAVMKDPRIVRMMVRMKDPKRAPFEPKRMSYGGFEVLVDA